MHTFAAHWAYKTYAARISWRLMVKCCRKPLKKWPHFKCVSEIYLQLHTGHSRSHVYQMCT